MIQSVRSCRAVYEKFTDGGDFNAETQRRREGGRVSSRAIEVPLEIPDTWCWARVGDVFSMQAGKYISAAKLHPQSNDHKFPCYGGNGVRGFLQCYSYEGEHAIVGRQGALCGNLNLATGKFYATEHAVVVDTYCGINAHFAYWFLMAMNLNQYATATAQPGLSVKVVLNSLFPLPPLAEQKRIVAKIETLMPLVEEYGGIEETRLQLDADLPSSLEKSILQETIQGRLIPQDPNDEPASELLKRVVAERKALVKAGKLKRGAGESVIFRDSDRLAYETRNGETVCIQDEIPFEIPDSWEWVRLGTVITLLSGRDLEPSEYSASQKKFPYMTGASNFGDGKLIVNRWTDKVATISHSGDLLITCKGTIGTMAFNTIGDIHIARQIMAISSHWINLGYVKVYLESIVHSLKSAANSMIPGIDRSTMLNLLIPLPPLNEQKRIVKRVEELKATTRTLVTF